MNKNIIITVLVVVVVILFASFWFNKDFKPEISISDKSSLEESRGIAKNWIEEDSLTYVFDGNNLNLIEESLINEETHLFLFSFESQAAGYGDRSGEILAQVITPHEIEVKVKKGEVLSAITDNVFSEISGKMIDTDEEASESEEAVLEEALKIDVYFIEVIEGKEELVAVEREIPYTLQTAQASIEELLKGPSSSEVDNGFSTSIGEEVELQNIYIEDKIAYVDFNEALEEGVAGSAWVTSIRNQIAKTLSQFDAVDEVVISINGETEDILQP